MRSSKAGHADARAAGEWLASEGFSPTHVLVSSARRAQETWADIASGGGWAVDAESSQLLYSAEPDTVLDLVREVPADASSVVVVGHNPTMAYLATMVDDGDGDQAASVELASRGFPTCSVAVFDYDGAWADLDVACASLVAFHVGRG